MASQTVSLTLSIASADLPALMALAAKSGASISASSGGKVKKEKKPKDPNAPKKEPNDWINFTQRARAALIASGAELKGFVGQQYCAVLKEKLPTKSITDDKGKAKDVPDYDSISDAEIVSRFKGWTPPEQSKAAAAKADSKESSPVAAPVAPAAPAAPAEKPKRQWSEAAKASAAEKRAQKKAGAPAPAAAPATAWASPVERPTNAAAAPVAAAEEDITEFAPVKIQGKSYLRNCRGDLLTEEYDWVGRFENGKINTKFAKPEDLEE
jgi:hypothetical protein